MALANLCVSYIMTSLNEKAEDLLRQVGNEKGGVGWKGGCGVEELRKRET